MRIGFIAPILWLLGACAAQPEAEPVAPAKTVQEAWQAGYKLVSQNGETVYCREQLMTGSHMRKETICLTEKEIKIAREASKRNLEQMQRRTPLPAGN